MSCQCIEATDRPCETCRLELEHETQLLIETVEKELKEVRIIQAVDALEDQRYAFHPFASCIRYCKYAKNANE